MFDLGAGDGRVLIAAAKQYGARGVGYELDRELAARASQCVADHGLGALIRIVRADAATADVSSATCLCLYLSESGNRRLLQAVRSTLQPGTRVVSYIFPVEGWERQLRLVDRTDNLPVFLYAAPAAPAAEASAVASPASAAGGSSTPSGRRS